MAKKKTQQKTTKKATPVVSDSKSEPAAKKIGGLEAVVGLTAFLRHNVEVDLPNIIAELYSRCLTDSQVIVVSADGTESKPYQKGVEKSGYDWIKAIRSQGKALLQYQVTGLEKEGRDVIDDNVEDWADGEIQKITCDMLDIDRKFAHEVLIEEE